MFDTYTPGQAPLLRRLLGLFPKKPPHTPLHKPPLPRGRGPSAPSPMYSPPVFCLTSTEILNVLSSPGPVCVSKGGEDAVGSGGSCRGSCCKCGSGPSLAPAPPHSFTALFQLLSAPPGSLCHSSSGEFSLKPGLHHSPIFSQSHNPWAQFLHGFDIEVFLPGRFHWGVDFLLGSRGFLLQKHMPGKPSGPITHG